MSIEAEQHLLGCVLVDEKQAPALLEIPEAWFIENAHKLIYRAFESLARDNLSIDIFSLEKALNQSKQLESIGGIGYLNDLAENLPSLSHWASYKANLFESYKKWKISKMIGSVQNQMSTNSKPSEMIDFIQNSVIELLTDHHSGGPKHISSFMDEVIADMMWRMENPNKLRGCKTGFDELDKTFDGFEKGKMYLIAGRPGSGKTQFGLVNLGLKLAVDRHVVAFSLEMTGRGLAQRAICSEANLYNSKIRDGSMTNFDIDMVAAATTRIHQTNKLHIDESANLSTAQMRSRLKAHELKYGEIGAVIVDHVGLIRKEKGKDETQGLTQISHDLAQMAKEFNCPFIVLSQLNRGVESRSDKRPMLSDLKQSGALEEDARGVMLIYRDDYYNKDSDSAGVTEIIVAKNSDGETKTLYFSHNLAMAKYEPIDGYTAPEKQASKKW